VGARCSFNRPSSQPEWGRACESAHDLCRARDFTQRAVGARHRSCAWRAAPGPTPVAQAPCHTHSPAFANSSGWPLTRIACAWRRRSRSGRFGPRFAPRSLACGSGGRSCCADTSRTFWLPMRGSSWKWTAPITRAGAGPTRTGTVRSVRMGFASSACRPRSSPEISGLLCRPLPDGTRAVERCERALVERDGRRRASHPFTHTTCFNSWTISTRSSCCSITRSMFLYAFGASSMTPASLRHSTPSVWRSRSRTVKLFFA
jgi:hypothetical protein